MFQEAETRGVSAAGANSPAPSDELLNSLAQRACDRTPQVDPAP
jgi:hypothetical protein